MNKQYVFFVRFVLIIALAASANLGCFFDTPVEYPVMGSGVNQETLVGEWESPVFFDDFGGAQYFIVTRIFSPDSLGGNVYMHAVEKISVYKDSLCTVPMYSAWTEYDIYLRDEYLAYLNYGRQAYFSATRKFLTISDVDILNAYNSSYTNDIPIYLNETRDVTLSGGTSFISRYNRIGLLFPDTNGSNVKQVLMIKDGFLYTGNLRLKKDGEGYPTEILSDWYYTKTAQ